MDGAPWSESYPLPTLQARRRSTALSLSLTHTHTRPPPLSLSPSLSLRHRGEEAIHRKLCQDPLASRSLKEEQLLRRNVKRFRGGLVFQAHRLLYHSTLGLRVIKKKRSSLKWFPECSAKTGVCLELPYRWGLEAHASRDHTLAGPLWEGCRESRRCSRDTYPESYITEYTLVYEEKNGVCPATSKWTGVAREVRFGGGRD